MLHTLIFALLVSLFLSTSADAAFRDKKIVTPISSISVTPTIGGYAFSGSDAVYPAPIFGLKVSYDMIGSGLSDSLGIEGTVNYFTTVAEKDSKSAKGFLFRADAIYPFFPRKTVVPFLAVGIGDMLVNRGTGNESDFLFNYGAGLKYYLEDYLVWRVDARQIFAYSNVTTRNNFELSTGLTYIFGKERKKPAPKPKPEALGQSVMKPVQEAPVPLDPAKQSALLQKFGTPGPSIVGFNMQRPIFVPEPAEPTAAPVAPSMGPMAPAGTIPAKEKPKEEMALVVIEVPTSDNARPSERAAASSPAPKPAPVQTPAPEVQAPALAKIQQIPTRKNLLRFVIEFPFGKSDIRAQYLPALQEAAALVKASGTASVHIVGHTDNIGKYDPNIALSLQRANSVKSKFVSFGVDPDKITTEGRGYTKPAADNRTSKGRQRNRRAVTTVTGEE